MQPQQTRETTTIEAPAGSQARYWVIVEEYGQRTTTAGLTRDQAERLVQVVREQADREARAAGRVSAVRCEIVPGEDQR